MDTRRMAFASVSEMTLYGAVVDVIKTLSCACGDESLCVRCSCEFAKDLSDSLFEKREKIHMEALEMAAKTNPLPGL